ncbi:hypothetical protein PIB30_053051 [Stylosanthes scabra]|uniref:Uncharacterized protein n=1 Tax=Stylosanthes scabra TaxID=79078 RepID=A0ABU6UKD8_9FABA|nr:hypothetical protein [Stylosanthes scabra]
MAWPSGTVLRRFSPSPELHLQRRHRRCTPGSWLIFTCWCCAEVGIVRSLAVGCCPFFNPLPQGWLSPIIFYFNELSDAEEHRHEAGSTACSARMPSPMPPPPPPPPPLQHGPASATDQPPSDADGSPHDDPDYV